MQSAFATPQRARTLRACLQSAADECSVLAPKPVAAVHPSALPLGQTTARKYRRSGTPAGEPEGCGFPIPARSDAGREILEILSRRQEPPPLFGSSPPARSGNPLINDRSFRRPQFDATEGLWSVERRF